MSLLQLASIIAVRRTLSSWGVELVLFLGIVLAVTLMSSGVVFSELLEEVALRRTMGSAAPEEANLSMRTYGALTDPALVPRHDSPYQTGVDAVEERVATPLRPYLEDQALVLSTLPFFFEGHPQLELTEDPEKVRPRGRIQYVTGLLPHRVEVVEGRWPYSGGGASPSPDQPLEVALDALGAELLGLGVGDEMEAYPVIWRTEAPSIDVRIVALFQRTDPEDEFWYGAGRTFSRVDGDVALVPLFTTEEAILGHVGAACPGARFDLSWYLYMDRQGLRAGDVGAIQGILQRIERDVRSGVENVTTAIRLDELLEAYEEEVLLARIPVFLMVSLTTGILVYYLMLASGLVVRSRSTEIAVLKSRGATTLQIGLLTLVEGLLLAVPAVLLGPLLAVGLSRALGGIFVDVPEGAAMVTVGLSYQALLLGVGGAVLAVAVLTLSTLIAARQGIVEFRQSGARPPRAPLFHRYYLDILTLALMGLLWWQIQARGSLLVRSVGTGELEIDFSLLVGPVLGLLALGLLVMRLFPLAASLAAWAAESVGPVWLVQGLRRVSRDPIIPGTLVVLLMLTTALGVIGSTFSSTLERSQRDRAMYVVGADLRLVQGGSRGLPSLAGQVSEVAERLDGVEAAAEVVRTSSTLLTGGLSAPDVAILAVDAESFADVGWYRPDFAGGRSLGALMEVLRSSNVQDDGIRLPPKTGGLAVWVQPSNVDPRMSLMARLQDSRGLYFDVLLGRLDFKGWQRLEAPLSPLPDDGITLSVGPTSNNSDGPYPVGRYRGALPPFNLLSLRVVAGRGVPQEPGAIFLEGLVATTTGEDVPLGDLKSLDGWHIVEDYSAPGLYALEPSASVTRPGMTRSAAFTWVSGGVGLRSIRAGGPEAPIPAVVSRDLLDLANARVGDTITVGMYTVALPIQAVAVASYFPTLNPKEEPFLVVDMRAFVHGVNLHGEQVVGERNELWLDLDGTDRAAETAIHELQQRGIDVNEAYIAQDMVSQRVEQPFINAGWGGLLVLMFLSLVLASASGVMLFSYTDTQERQTEFALLRTLGISRRQLRGVVWFNLCLVVACGIGLGTWTGQRISTGLLPVLEVAEEGIRVTPPMMLQTDWGTLLLSYLALALVAAGAVAWLTWITARMEIQRVLRIGDA